MSLNYYVIFSIQYKRHSKLVYNATLGDKFNIMVLLHHITVYSITKLHYSWLLYLITSWLFIWYCFLLFCFYFHFYSSISFLFTLQILFNLMLHWMLYLVFVLFIAFIIILCHYLSHVIPWARNWGKDQQFHSAFSLDIYKNTFLFFCLF